MMRKFGSSFACFSVGLMVLFLVLFPSRGSAQVRPISWSGTGSWVSWERALALRKMSKKPICVFVYSSDCRHCYKVSSLFRSTMMQRIMSHFKMVRYNASRSAKWYAKIKPHLGMYYPKFLFFKSTGEFLKNVNTGHRTLPYAYNYERPKRLMKDMLKLSCRFGIRRSCKSKKKAEKIWKRNVLRMKRKALSDQKRAMFRRRKRREKRRAPNLTPALYKQYKRACFRRRQKTYCWELILWHQSRGTRYEDFRALRVARFLCDRLRIARACLKAAQLYRNSRRVRVNYKKARLYYSRACRLRHGKGCAMIGHFYTRGWGGFYKDCGRARAMFKLGCRLGYSPSCSMNCR